MIYPITMYAGKCDNCGKEARLGGGEYSAYNDELSVREDIGNSEWLIGTKENGHEYKHYCPDCWTYDDDDNIIIHKTNSNDQ